MKKKHLLAGILTVFTAIFLLSCFEDSSSSGNRLNQASLTNQVIDTGVEGSEELVVYIHRAVGFSHFIYMVEEYFVASTFVAKGTGPGGETFSLSSNKLELELQDLIDGEWTISIEAKNKEGETIASGSESLTVTGGTSEIVIPLKYFYRIHAKYNFEIENPDIVSDYIKYEYNSEGKLNKILFCANYGPDCLWHTDDDRIDHYILIDYIDNNHSRLFYYEKGYDQLSFTNDDVLSNYFYNTHDVYNNIVESINYYGPGTDGIFSTADDPISYKKTMTYNKTGRVKITENHFKGSDTLWDTDDDWYLKIIRNYNEYDQNIFDVTYSAPGTDGIWFTGDDIEYDYFQYSFKYENEGYTYTKTTNQKGQDNIWDTADDIIYAIISNYHKYGFIEKTNHHDSGDDNIFFTPDDTIYSNNIIIYERISDGQKFPEIPDNVNDIIITPPAAGTRLSEVTYWGWAASSFTIDINVASNNPIESVSNATHVSGDTYRITIQPGTSFFLPPYQYTPYTINVVVRTVDGTEKNTSSNLCRFNCQLFSNGRIVVLLCKYKL